MASKRAKLTADKARQRIVSLEESIVTRGQRLEQLRARVARSSSPEDKLLAALERTERRIALEKEQVQKLKRLLKRHEPNPQPEDSSEYFNSEEIDDLHRSFEEVKQDLSQVKIRLEGTEVPRDLPKRLTSFEERITRREEADSDLFTQILSLQTALDEERQTVRRLSRRIREQDQNLDALREAVEDSVVATVDMAERLEELEEGLNDGPSTEESTPQIETLKSQLLGRMETFSARLDELGRDLREVSRMSSQAQVPEPPQAPQATQSGSELELVMEALREFDTRLEEMEQRSLEPVSQNPPEQGQTEEAPEAPKEEPVLEERATEESNWIPAKFSTQGNPGRLVAKFSAPGAWQRK